MEIAVRASIERSLTGLEKSSFLFLCATGVIIAIVGFLGNVPLLGLIAPYVLIVLYLVTRRDVLVILLFASFSVAIHFSEYSTDILFVAPAVIVYLLCRSKSKISQNSSVNAWAVGNAVWAVVTSGLLFLRTGSSLYEFGIGTRLLTYFFWFVFVYDAASFFSAETLKRVLKWAWLFSLTVCIVALVQHYVFGQNRVSSILEEHHSHLGNYSVVAVMLGALVMTNKSTGYTFLSFASICIGLLSLIVSETRSDWTGAIVGFAVFGALRGVRATLIMLLLVGMVLGSGIANDTIQRTSSMTFEDTAEHGGDEKVQADLDVSSVDRVFIWIGVYSLEQESDFWHVLVGYGPGSIFEVLRPYLTLHRMYTAGESINGAHNNFLHVLLEEGVIGFVLLYGMLGAIMWNFWKARKRMDSNGRLIADVMIAGTLALIVSGFTQETFYSQRSMGNFLGLYMSLAALCLRILPCHTMMPPSTDKMIPRLHSSSMQ